MTERIKPPVTRCPSWADHNWVERRFIEAGQHPTMGHYQKFIVRCRHCGAETTETQWTDLMTAAMRPPVHFKKNLRG